jgi:hypothetical protein
MNSQLTKVTYNISVRVIIYKILKRRIRLKKNQFIGKFVNIIKHLVIKINIIVIILKII